MALIAAIEFDDDGADLHAHFTARAHELDGNEPREWLRVLRTFEDALTRYAQDIARVADRLEAQLEGPRE